MSTPLFEYSQKYCQRDDPIVCFDELLDDALVIEVELGHIIIIFNLWCINLSLFTLHSPLDQCYDYDCHHELDLDLEELEKLVVQILLMMMAHCCFSSIGAWVLTSRGLISPKPILIG